MRLEPGGAPVRARSAGSAGISARCLEANADTLRTSASIENLPVEHRRGHDEADAGDDLADAWLWDALRIVRPEKISGHRSQRHYQRFRPVDQSGEDEINRRDLIDERTEDGLDGVHLVNVGETETTQRGKHQNANAGAEVAAVNRHEKLKQDGRPDRATVWRRVCHGRVGKVGEATERALGDKKDRRKENEVRHHSRENGLARARQQNAADQPAQKAYGEESLEPRFHGGDLMAEAINASGGAEHKGERAAGVRSQWRR